MGASAGDAEAEVAVLSLGVGDPRLWPAIVSRGVRADAVSGTLTARVLRQVEQMMHQNGILPGLAELLSAAQTEAERETLVTSRANFPGVAHLDYWCERVVRAAQRQALVHAASALHRDALTRATDPAIAAATAMSALSAAVQPSVGTQIETPAAWTDGFLAEMERRRTTGVAGIPTGLPVLDEHLVVRAGDLVLIAAETGVGKSALGLSLSRAACRAGRKVAYLNTEMDDYAIQSRLIGAEAGIPIDHLLTGRLSIEESDAASVAAERMAQSGVLFLSRLQGLVGVGPEELLIALRAHHAQHGMDAFVLDYIGRLDVVDTASDKEYRVLKRLVGRMKCLAQELGVVAYVLVQRTVDGHLAGSKGMRDEADLVLELEPQAPSDPDVGPGATHRILVSKCRSWRSGFAIGVAFDLATMRLCQVGLRHSVARAKAQA